MVKASVTVVNWPCQKFRVDHIRRTQPTNMVKGPLGWLPSFACLLSFLETGDALGRKGDEQLRAVREAAQGAQALLALQAGLVLRRCVPERSVEGAQEVVCDSARCGGEDERGTSW